MTEGIVEVPGGSLYFQQSGEGEALVLIHAGIADSRMWDDQAHPFAERFHVICYDVRGFGRSSDAAGDFAHYEDLRTILDHLSLPGVHLVAVSMAGSIAIDFALAYPERVLSLTLVATGPNGYDRWGEEIRSGWAEEEAAIEAGDMERAIEINLRMWVDGPQRQPADVDPAVRSRVREMLELNLPRQGEGEAQDLEPAAINRLGDIRTPALVIVGDKDVPEIIDSSRLLAREIRGASIEEMAGVAHLPNMERPAEFNRLVLDFLAAARR
jgi:pimeloyl-ACP methyl ester carboxylesterase